MKKIAISWQCWSSGKYNNRETRPTVDLGTILIFGNNQQQLGSKVIGGSITSVLVDFNAQKSPDCTRLFLGRGDTICNRLIPKLRKNFRHGSRVLPNISLNIATRECSSLVRQRATRSEPLQLLRRRHRRTSREASAEIATSVAVRISKITHWTQNRFENKGEND